ncbi:four-carbon acid sugar kinase family protein [Roseomonas nepalensis]|uniref:3-oxo-tetronate kinase n=1 Tax=Muricoccus nepalensis TaxID=1854500 RepID=A0A502F3U2_9PROT|nr:3-oxo-tetronate kinase [Roseomonas nepalensis]TPG44825.1 four-carbon acid sugar kinase family protein [Roseomonas nepalensis]
MPLLGCVADDFTGATDLASTLVRGGMSAVQVIGVPDGPLPEADAVVVALKSRTNPARDAVRDSLAALDALRAAGCARFFFKYCSTFDSTDEGNIGPVADALLERLGAPFALACPAFPANGRSVYRGHLFVGDALLSESGMKDHPLTPMRDANLVRVLGRQTAGRVGLVNLPVVGRGAAAIRDAMAALAAGGHRYAIVDAVTEADLMAIGEAAAEHPLVTGGSGVAMGLPGNFRRRGRLPPRDAAALPARRGLGAVLAGSCSPATLGQVAAARTALPVLELDPLETPDAAALARRALDWAEGRLGAPIVIAASAPPGKVAALQARIGRDAAGALVEEALAAVAEGLVARGVGQLVVAGGETSGAVVSRLGLRALRIGAEIDPGVPWTHAEGPSGGLHLALKSGNFGAPDFFAKAFGRT